MPEELVLGRIVGLRSVRRSSWLFSVLPILLSVIRFECASLQLRTSAEWIGDLLIRRGLGQVFWLCCTDKNWEANMGADMYTSAQIVCYGGLGSYDGVECPNRNTESYSRKICVTGPLGE